MWEVTEVKKNERRTPTAAAGLRTTRHDWAEYHQEPRVYFSPQSAEGVSETILQDLMRRVNRVGRPWRSWKPLVKSALIWVDIELNDDVKVSWSKLAGCTTCPCSPGFVLKGYRRLPSEKPFDVWITVQPERTSESGNNNVSGTEGDSSMQGKYFVITGKMEFLRKDLIRKIEAAGGTVQTSVTNSTDFVVCNPLPDGHKSNKVKAAERKGIPVLTEDELMAALP